MQQETAQSTVSVILPVKDGERFLAEAIESALGQTYPVHEILVIDGSSNEASARIARNYEPVRYQRQRHQGLARAYNQGIQSVEADLVAFLACDDLWQEEKLADQVGFLDTHPEYNMVHGRVRHALEPGSVLPVGFRKKALDQEIDALLLESVLIRYSVFSVVGLFDPSYGTAGDTDWFARAKDVGYISHCLPQVLVTKRIHANNTSLLDVEGNQRALLKILRSSIRRKRGS